MGCGEGGVVDGGIGGGGKGGRKRTSEERFRGDDRWKPEGRRRLDVGEHLLVPFAWWKVGCEWNGECKRRAGREERIYCDEIEGTGSTQPQCCEECLPGRVFELSKSGQGNRIWNSRPYLRVERTRWCLPCNENEAI